VSHILEITRNCPSADMPEMVDGMQYLFSWGSKYAILNSRYAGNLREGME
jgi:hypothetical protein